MNFLPNTACIRKLAIMLSLTIAPATLHADVKRDAARALEMWQPISIDFSDGTLTATLPQRSITEEIYRAVLTTGLCFDTLRGVDFSMIKRLVVLNQHRAQGYVYERGGTDCDAILDEEQRAHQDLRFYILSATHLY